MSVLLSSGRLVARRGAKNGAELLSKVNNRSDYAKTSKWNQSRSLSLLASSAFHNNGVKPVVVLARETQVISSRRSNGANCRISNGAKTEFEMNGRQTLAFNSTKMKSYTVNTCIETRNRNNQNNNNNTSVRNQSFHSKSTSLFGCSSLFSLRAMSTSTTNNSDYALMMFGNNVVSCASADDEIAKFEKLALESSTSGGNNVTDNGAPPTSIASDSISNTIPSSTSTWEATWWPQDQMIDLINYIHDMTGVNYALTIAGLTLSLRIFMFPLFVKAQQNSSRMAHMKPEMDILKQKIDSADSSDTQLQMQYGMQMKQLFKKYDCNPLKALVVPLVQAPLFMSMFFALRNMPDHFPDELSTGGTLWFTDLTAHDPYYVLPILSAISFYGMIETGKTQMLQSGQQGQTMLNVMRGLALFMIPVTMNFSTAIFSYWTTNNFISLAQSALFQSPTMRKSLGIWEMPKPIPGAAPPKGIMEQFQEALDKARNKDNQKNINMTQPDKIKAHNEAIDMRRKLDSITTKRYKGNRRKQRK